MHRAKYVYARKIRMLLFDMYQPPNILPTMLKRPISPKDHPDTVGEKPHTWMTPGMWVAIKAT